VRQGGPCAGGMYADADACIVSVHIVILYLAAVLHLPDLLAHHSENKLCLPHDTKRMS
jgi:hypothetical protein